MMRVVAAMLVAMCAGAGAVEAGELADAGALAEAQVAGHRYLEALATLVRAEDSVWEEIPLSFRKALFVASDPKGFGLYDVHQGDTFKRADPIIVYAEPVGYGFAKQGDLNIIDLSVDFELRTKDGRPVGNGKNVASPGLRSHAENREFSINVVYDFSTLPAGSYEVTTTVSDRTTGKSGSFSLPFTLIE
ncbi:MAG: hypothetical protein ACJ8AS_02855 [Hyphomicrobiales bacterium]